MIEVKGLVKEFGAFRAVDQIDFEVPSGQVLGFLGPNGAGKSTTMKMLTCFLEPTAGTAVVGGHDIGKDPIAVRKMIGYLPESAPSYAEMTVEEFLDFIAEMRGMRGGDKESAKLAMREKCFLESVWHQPIETLSKGYRQRVGFAQALIHDPPILIMDEPTDGLDPNQKHEVRELIKHMGKDKTIILSTHILEEVEAVCQRVIIIAGGKLVADAAPSDLVEQSSIHNAVTMRFADKPASGAVEDLRTVTGVDHVELMDSIPNALRVYPKGGKTIVADVSEVARQKQWPLEQLRVEHGRLDEVFRKVTTNVQSAN